jgi:cytochrome bd ubiquinol oxidase subunit II
MDLSIVWAAIIVVGVVMYVILDGFDLGVGILSPWVRSDSDRSVMMSSVAPVWDGNETWLVLGGVAIMAAFPRAYASLLPALYAPIFLFLFGLIFRGVAFEFRHRAERSRRIWNYAFAIGSTLAAFAQGVILGAFIEGFELDGATYVGGPFDWFSLFAIFIGVAMVVGYALLGATWLIMKTSGDFQDWCYRAAIGLGAGVLAAMAVVSLWTPIYDPEIAERWFSWPRMLWLLPVPVVTALVFLGLWRSLARRREIAPFVFSIAAFLLGFLGLAISMWPYIVPRHLTIWQAASTAQSQGFLLVGALIMLPIILIYTGHNYWVFRGKADRADGY